MTYIKRVEMQNDQISRKRDQELINPTYPSPPSKGCQNFP